MNDLISIIVPVYKVERYLKKCIDSIISQTYTNLEIILVDDESPDNCPAICDDYKKKDKRVKVIHKKNGGLSDARNAGIEIAKGNYIGFVDSDDYIDKKMIEVLYSNIIKYKGDISICNYAKIKELSDDYDFCKENDVKIFDTTEGIKSLLMDRIESYAWNKLYKKELFHNVRYPYNKKFEDMGTTFKLIGLSNKIIVTNYCGYFYLDREGSITNNITKEAIIDYMEMYHKMINYCNKYKNVQEEVSACQIKYTVLFHNLCAKTKNDEIYNGKELLDDYNTCKELIKKNKKSDYYTKADLKRKIAFRLLFYNRNLFYKITSKL